MAALPRLAELLGIPLEDLMQGRKPAKEDLVGLVLKAVALAMGVAVVVTNALGKLETGSAVSLLGLGLTVLAIQALRKK